MFSAILISGGMGASKSGHSRPSYHKTPAKYDYNDRYDVPYCAKNTTKPWCLGDPDYPLYDIQHALNEHYETIQALYKDMLANTANSVDGLKKLGEETYLCPSSTEYIQPMRAVNTDGKWRIIVNKAESYGHEFTQTVRIEECQAPVGKACPLVPSCYESKCVQKNVFHRFLVYDPYDPYFPFAMESFKLPASCGCVVGAFFP